MVEMRGHPKHLIQVQNFREGKAFGEYLLQSLFITDVSAENQRGKAIYSRSQSQLLAMLFLLIREILRSAVLLEEGVQK